MDEKEILELAEKLSDENVKVRMDAGRAIWVAANKGADISPVMQALINALDDENRKVRAEASGALEAAAGMEADIASAMPALIRKIEDEYYLVRERSTGAIRKFAWLKAEKKDILPAIPTLIEVIGEEEIMEQDASCTVTGSSNVGKNAFATLVTFARFWCENKEECLEFLREIKDCPKAKELEIKIYKKWIEDGMEEEIVRDCENKQELLEFLREIKGSPEARELAMDIYKEWMKEKNKKTGELQRMELRKPPKTPDGNNLKRANRVM
ncbi:HEAT repeat domain-containing protein [Candidatus Micrarchaeota archaeon]|nr:HEAT repeat domain-containing protein [Candidatus Micrarchaeota archaeon]